MGRVKVVAKKTVLMDLVGIGNDHLFANLDRGFFEVALLVKLFDEVALLVELFKALLDTVVDALLQYS